MQDDKSELWKVFYGVFVSDPQLWVLMQQFTQEMIATKRARYSARTIWERIRWHIHVTTSDSEFKINDHWSPYFSRVFMWAYPEYGPSSWRGNPPMEQPWGCRKPLINDGFFELRTVGTNIEIELKLFIWARGSRLELFLLEEEQGATCRAEGCDLVVDLVEIPGEMWGKECASLCLAHAQIALAYAEEKGL